MKYTIAQFEKHGTLMLEYYKDPSIEIQHKYKEGSWMDYPIGYIRRDFSIDLDYRKKPTPIFTNDLGEEITQEDINSDVGFHFDHKQNALYSCVLRDVYVDFDVAYKVDKHTISKTKQGALQLAIKEMNKLNK